MHGPHMNKLPSRQKITELFEIRNTLVNCQSINEVVRIGVEVARDKVGAQTASIFLFSKDDLLRRAGIIGIDKHGLQLNDNWNANESYQVGESFTGKAIIPTDKSPFGTPQFSINLEQDEISSISRSIYLEKLGILKCAMAVPISGQHRTYGVLEVINKVDEQGQIREGWVYSEEDAYVLTIISTSVATAISNLRRIGELQMLADVSEKLIEPFREHSDLKETCRYIAVKLTDSLFKYMACRIWIMDSENNLNLLAEAVFNENEKKKDFSFSSFAGAIEHQVFETGELKIVENIEFDANLANKLSWTQINKFVSVICMPLSIDNTNLGVITLYTSARDKFHGLDKIILKNISYLLSSVVRIFSIIGQLRDVRREFVRLTDQIVSTAGNVGHDYWMQEVLHQYKNELLNLQRKLEESVESSPGRQRKIVQEQILWITNRIHDIRNQFEQVSLVRVDINRTIRDVVRYFSLDRNSNIHFNLNLGSIADIEANEADIKVVILNIVSNAIKATEVEFKKDPTITIETEVIDVDRITYIQISIEDNGVGIKKEVGDLVFKQGFTTYPGGTGMGLFITRNILRNYSGKIHFDSSVGRGTTFYVRIPLKRFEWNEDN